MTQDALKEYIIEKKKLWETDGKVFSCSAAEYKKCLSRLKNKVEKDRKEYEKNDSYIPESELQSRLHIFEEAYAAARSNGVFPDKKTLYICGSVLRDHISFFQNEASLKEAVRLIYEVCFGDNFFTDENCRAVPSAFYLEGIRLAYISVQTSPKDEKHVSVRETANALKLISEFDFSPFITAFSPIERLWRNINWQEEDIYKISDPKTKALMRCKVKKEAEKRGANEINFLKELAFSKDPDEKIRSIYMKSSSGVPYFSTLVLIFLVFSISLFFILHRCGTSIALSLILTFFCALPLYSSAKFLSDNVFSRIFPAEVLPKLSENAFSQVKDKCQTLVVITALFAGEKDVNDIFHSLEKRYLSSEAPEETNTDLTKRTLRFSVLADLPEKSGENAENNNFTEAEKLLLEKAEEKLSALNKKYGNIFYLFTRKRTLSPDGVYRGWERKRGALLSLSAFLCKKESEIICVNHKTLPRELENIKYVLTLDSDTENGFCGIYPLIATMAHPFNKPKVSKTGVKHVYKGTAIIQPAMRTLLFSSRKTPFSLISSGVGLDVYNGPFYDTYQTIFKNGIFCGKGIFDLKVYNEVLEDAFPDNIVLSHDLLEGARLSASFMSEASLYDTTPASAFSYIKRASRWIRGDIQALEFAKKYVPTRTGKKKLNPIRRIYRFALWDNAARALLPAAALVCLFLSLFIPSTLASSLTAFAALSPYLFPPVISLFTLLLSKNRNPLLRRFLVNTFSGVYRSFLVCGYKISSLAENAYVSADSVIRSLYRMKVSKKRLLEWQTFSQTEAPGTKRDTLLYHYKKSPFSVISGSVLLIFPTHIVTFLSGILMILFPMIAFLSSIPYKSEKKERISKKQADTLTEYAKASWKYFEDNVNESTNYLPPDNVAIAPGEVTAMRTSPTNIGLFLTSAVAAFDMGFIDEEKLFTMLDKALSSIEQLKKYKGHLYNWYDIETLAPLGDFVSSVDSGNYCACLICLEQFLKEFKENIPYCLSKRTEALRKICDFSVFLNKKRGFLSIGINGAADECDKICYDRYMSESRITSYIASAARQVPASMWFSLGRTLLESSFFLGCASWSGTCFEYFMPCLFLPTHPESFTEEALKFAFAHQKKFSFPFPDTNGKQVYGISESCYYSFDEDMNYRYKAFGIPALALDEEAVRERRHVISPYSSFLMLRMSPSGILNNLSALKDGGMYGKYGFYEAADIKEGRARIVKCFMAHHIGMSLMACDNLLNDDIFAKRFMRDEQMAGAESILGESVPADAPVHTCPEPSHNTSPSLKRQYSPHKTERMSRVIYGNEKAVTLSGHNINAVVSDNGTFFLSTRSKEITDITKRPITSNSHGGIVLYGYDGNNVISSFMTERDKRTFSHTGNTCTLVHHTERSEKRTLTTFGAALSGEARSAVFSVSSSKALEKAGIYIDVCADTYESFRSHPAFSSMFLFCEKQKRKDIYLFERRQRDGNRKPFFMAVGAIVPRGHEDNTIIETESFLRDDLANLSSYPYNAVKMIMAEKSKSSSSEKKLSASFPMLSPEFLLTASVRDKYGKKDPSVRKIVFILSCGTTASEAVSAYDKTAEKIRSPFGNDIPVLPAELSAEDTAHGSVILKNTFYKVFHPSLSEESLSIRSSFNKSSLWSLGISGDVPIITMRVTERTPRKDIISLLRLHLAHNSAGAVYDLVFSVNEPGGYYTPASTSLRSIIEREGCSYMMNAKGGIFIIINENGSSELLFRCCSKLFFNELSDVQKSSVQLREKESPMVINTFERAPYTHSTESSDMPNEGFSLQGYTFDKDKKPAVPYAHVIASQKFGTVVTDSSLGFTWWKNSQQSRLTFWDGGIYSDSHLSESLSLEWDMPYDNAKVRWDPIKCAKRISYSKGRADYYGIINEWGYKISVAVHPKLPLKAVQITFYPSLSAETCEISAFYSFTKVPGSIPGGTCNSYAERKDSSAVVIRTIPDDDSVPSLFIKGKGGKFDFLPSCNENSVVRIRSRVSKKCEMTFFIGTSVCAEQERFLTAYTSLYGLESIFGKYEEYISPLIPKDREITYTPSVEKSSFFNFWLPYQAIVCRMNARSGLYQSGGAYGFRDQLQDCLVYLESSSVYAKRMILKTASRQFEEGDVLHWFHVFTKDGRAVTSGIRSLCSDDYLWLIFVTCEYIEKTRDRDILDISVPFLSEPELRSDEKERYINDVRRGERRSLREHLYKAAELFTKRGTGKHSLALMLGGDWNDGMNNIGENGGESVWLTMFAMICFSSLASLIKHEEPDKAKKLNSAVSEMFEAVNKYGRGEKWFGRAYYSDGTPVGFDTSLKSGCSIDAISQSFAMYVYHRIPFLKNEEFFNFIKLSLNCAYDELFDEETGIVKLFTPPFARYGDKLYHTEQVHDPGYIGKYPEGMRENGGQYTHGALWLADAFLLCAEHEKGRERLVLLERGKRLFKALIPYRKEINGSYCREPYVLCADIYSHDAYYGRGGWSWYTGSAGWMYRIYRSHIDKLKDLQ